LSNAIMRRQMEIVGGRADLGFRFEP
jgi:hypothetical protein